MKRFTNKEIKNRQYLFIIGCVIAVFVCYKYAIANTIHLYAEYQAIETNHPNQNQKSATISAIELKKINNLLVGLTVDTLTIREKLLDNVNSICLTNNCKIVNFPETVKYNEFNMLLASNTIELEGSYFNLLKTLNTIENHKSIGKVNSCTFLVVEHLFSKTKKLRMNLTIQNIIN